MSSLITNVIPSSSSLSPTRFSASLACNWILLVIWSFRNFWIGQLVLWTKFFYCLSSSRLMPTLTKSFSLFVTVLSSATSKNRLSLSSPLLLIMAPSAYFWDRKKLARVYFYVNINLVLFPFVTDVQNSLCNKHCSIQRNIFIGELKVLTKSWCIQFYTNSPKEFLKARRRD